MTDLCLADVCAAMDQIENQPREAWDLLLYRSEYEFFMRPDHPHDIGRRWLAIHNVHIIGDIPQ